MINNSNSYIQVKLETELQRLTIKYGRGKELEVYWTPREIKETVCGEERRIYGKVEGNTIYVYDETLEESLDTLVHEFLEYVLDVTFIRRHQNLFNALMKGWQEYFDKELYSDKEAMIETLVKCEREERGKKTK